MYTGVGQSVYMCRTKCIQVYDKVYTGVGQSVYMCRTKCIQV